MSNHKWDRGGERCVKCGDKDWMGTQCSVPDSPKFSHLESAECPCVPTLDYVDPDTGTSVWLHKQQS
jgi:hypothetical protein